MKNTEKDSDSSKLLLYCVTKFLSNFPQLLEVMKSLKNKCEEFNLYPQRTTFNGKPAKRTYEDLLIAHPQLNPKEIFERALALPPTFMPSFNKNLHEWINSRELSQNAGLPPNFFHKFEWKKTFVGHIKQTYDSDFCPVLCVRVDHEGNKVLTGADDKLIKVWDANNGTLLYTMKGHRGEIADILITPCNRYVISGCTSGDLIVWELETGDIITQNNDAAGEISSLEFFKSYEGDLFFISCSKSGRACVYSESIFDGSEDSGMVWYYSNDSNKMLCVSPHPAGNFVAIGTRKGLLQIWSLKPLETRAEYDPKNHLMCVLTEKKSSDINFVEWSPCGNFLITGSLSHHAVLWKFDRSLYRKFIENNRNPIEASLMKITEVSDKGKTKCYSISWNLSGDYALICAENTFVVGRKGASTPPQFSLKLWSKKEMKVVCALGDEKCKHKNKILSLRKHPTQDNIMLSADFDGLIIIWDLFRRIAVKSFKESGNFILAPILDLPLVDCNWFEDGTGFVVSSQIGTFSIYGVGGRDEYIASPIQQFFTSDYSLDNAMRCVLADKFMHPHPYQPPVPIYYLSRGISQNQPSPYQQRYEYGLQEEKKIEFLQERDEFHPLFMDANHLDESEEEAESSISSLESEPNDEEIIAPEHDNVLVVETDPYCARCKGILDVQTMWCYECNQIYHPSCLKAIESQVEKNVCILCFKKAIGSINEVPHARRKMISRDYLELEDSDASRYIPQVGDQVVFFLQGYESFLKHHQNYPLLDSELLSYIQPTYMEIEAIEYIWPGEQNLDSTTSHIIMKLTFKVYKEDKLHKALYMLDDFLPEYIVLKDIFDKKLRHVYPKLKPGNVVYAKIDGGLYRAIIKEISCKEEAFRDSPWEAIVVEYLDDVQPVNQRSRRNSKNSPRLSFWEIELSQSYDISLICPISSEESILECSERIRSLMSDSRANYFNQKISSTEIKNYYNEVMVPSYIRLIHDRIINRYYRTQNAILEDIDLMINNSVKINGERAKITRNGNYITDKLKMIINKYSSKELPFREISIQLPKASSHVVGYEYPWNVEWCMPREIVEREDTEVEVPKKEDGGRRKLRKTRER
ncbi:unnamed protein product [Blepharisma stoltei]|uniref:Bromo domain-containing protein n=1 Tax=Blepharisma stoltei TaxID=1481888 RepID=A0AAU9KB93_9CILI|nr:unnamed protein product [Blepharisma stoltei]